MQTMRTFISVFSAVLLGASTAAVAVPIATSGGSDTLVDAANISPSDESEMAYLAGLLGIPLADLDYTKFEGATWEAVTGGPAGTNLWAFSFGTETPDGFLIKTGGNICLVAGTNPTGDPSCPTEFNTYGYLNVASLNWAVIDLALFGATTPQDITIGIVSHLSSGGGGNGTVPEPGVLSLLGAGLLGIALFRRRRMSA